MARDADRRTRLAEALRSNLKRRKAQARAEAEAPASTPVSDVEVSYGGGGDAGTTAQDGGDDAAGTTAQDGAAASTSNRRARD